MPSNKRDRETTCILMSPQLKCPEPRTPRSGHVFLCHSCFQWGRETPYTETRGGLREQSSTRFWHSRCIFSDTTGSTWCTGCQFTNVPQVKVVLTALQVSCLFVACKPNRMLNVSPRQATPLRCGMDGKLYLNSDPTKMIKCFPWATCCAWRFLGHISFNPHNHLTWFVLLLSFHTGGN